MEEIKCTLNRREFIKTVAGLYFYSKFFNPLSAAGNTKVILVRDKNAIDDKMQCNQLIIQEMIDKAVCKLTEQEETNKAWATLFKSSDIVGIKSNVWGFLPTPKEVEAAIKKRLLDIGIKEENISIDDRGVLSNPIFKKATALINVRPLRTHYWAGIGGCIKNYIMFVENPSDYHEEYCSPLGKIWKFPFIKNKTRLNILVALTPLFYGTGPHHYNAKYVWSYKGLLAGFDPVAVDSVGVKLLKAKRKSFFGREVPFTPPPIHIIAADKEHNIGVSDLDKIKIEYLGWKDDILI
jgi:hypothetical protein